MSTFLRLLLKRDKMGRRFWERDILVRGISARQANAAAMAELCRQMSFMLGAGVMLGAVMTVLAESESKSRAALQRALDGIMRGESLSQALEGAGHFPGFMCSMCRIGEISDDLPRVMALLADYYEESARSREEIRSALMYPAVVALMMLAMIVVAVLYVLPHYALMFAISDVPLPMLTRALLGVSDILLRQWWLVIPAVFAAVMAPAAIVRTDTGRKCCELILLKLPPYRQMINLHIVQALALMLQSGQPVAEAVPAVSGIVANKVVSQDFQQAAVSLQEGHSLWTILQAITYIGPVIVNMARVGEETGNMAQAFKYASEYSRHRFRQMSKRLNKLVEPAVTLVLGLILGLVMLAIILPTFAMTELVGY